MNTIMPGSNELIEKVQYNIEPIRNWKKDKKNTRAKQEYTQA